MKECIGEVLQEMLKDHTYKQDEAPELTKQIADRVKNRLKLLELPRYKYMVQVVVGEQRLGLVSFELSDGRRTRLMGAGEKFRVIEDWWEFFFFHQSLLQLLTLLGRKVGAQHGLELVWVRLAASDG